MCPYRHKEDKQSKRKRDRDERERERDRESWREIKANRCVYTGTKWMNRL